MCVSFCLIFLVSYTKACLFRALTLSFKGGFAPVFCNVYCLKDKIVLLRAQVATIVYKINFLRSMFYTDYCHGNSVTMTTAIAPAMWVQTLEGTDM